MPKPIILNPREVVALAAASTAQARLGSGCVCAEGCEACDALAEAWEAMKAALHHAAPWLGKLIAEGVHHQTVAPNHAVRTLDLVEAALKLAEGVKRGR